VIRVNTLLAFVLFSVHIVSGQENESLPLRKPAPSDARPVNTLSFDLSASALNQLHADKGQKPPLKISRIVVNKDTLKVQHAHVRGNTSAYFRRKCFNIKTSKKSSFYNHADTFSLSKFYAISMNMDANYIRNKISFAILKLIGVHTPTNCYSELSINSASEGLYLVFYPPDEYAMKKLHATFVIRRGYKESIDKVYTAKGVNRSDARELEQKFRSLYATSTLNKRGEELYQRLSSVLDLNSYFSWLAFNHLFQNGDYSDEVYFMWNPEKAKFEIIPWDFDDILKDRPHEGLDQRGKSNANKLIFSFEGELDKAIASDPYLYKKYLEVYDALLDTLTASKLRDVLTDVYDDIYPYYVQDDVISQSQFDRYGKTDLTKLEADLNSIYQYISIRAIELRKNVKAGIQ